MKRIILFLLFFILLILSLLKFISSGAVKKNLNAFANSPVDYNKTFFVTAGAHRLGWWAFDYLHLAERLGGNNQPFIKVGMMGMINDSSQTFGDKNGNGILDEADCDYCFDKDSNIGKPPEDAFSDSLQNYLNKAIEWNTPIGFCISASGPWSDWTSSDPASSPKTNLSAYLEQDKNNVQWNQNNEVFSDDDPRYQNPPLNTILTLNAYNTPVRKYTRRNLLQAVEVVRQFAQEHPELFLAINIAQDLSMQSWNGHGYYDYNPGTIRQFRDWLNGGGVYAGQKPDEFVVIDYSKYKRNPSLTLSQVNSLAGRNWTDWNQVDPPRPSYPNANQNDLWWQEWTKFRQHLVDVWIEERIAWIVQAGIPKEKVFAHQGIDYTTLYTNQYIANEDKTCMTVQSAEAQNGASLGICSAIDNYPWLNPPFYYSKPFQQKLREFSDNWGNFEAYNFTGRTDGFRNPHDVPSYEESWQGLVANFNNHAHFLMLMAWNGSQGEWNNPSHPYYNAFESWTCIQKCPLENATHDFVRLYGQFPRGSMVWHFGAGPQQTKDQQDHSNYDGWNQSTNDIKDLAKGSGHIAFTLSDTGDGVFDPYLVSPNHLYFPASAENIIKIRMHSPGNTVGQILFRKEQTWHWGANFDIKAGWQGYTIPIGQNQNWQGEINQIRLDPDVFTNLVGQRITLDYIAILEKEQELPPSLSLSPGWNQITWPDVSGKKASDTPLECPIAVAKENFWFVPYVKNFGGVNFNFEKDKIYFLKCNQEVTWNL